MQPTDEFTNLSRTVLVNERLKQIMDISHRINLVAVNAILVAKRGGEQSTGFRVVAIELRNFSQKLSDAMVSLDLQTIKLVHGVAGLLKQERAVRLMQRANSLEARQAQDGVMPATHFDVGIATYSRQRAEIEAQWQQFYREIRHSVALCNLGSMLSHNGRIEAVYGGSMLQDMLQVANHIESIMSEAIDRLKSLQTSLH